MATATIAFLLGFITAFFFLSHTKISHNARSPTSRITPLHPLSRSSPVSFRQHVPLPPSASPVTVPQSAAPPVATPSPSPEHQLVLNLSTESTGVRHTTEAFVRARVTNPLSYGVYDDLLAFTGLTDAELMKRLKRLEQHHFAIEHQFLNPQSATELTMFYRASLMYLWGNAVHPSINHTALGLTPADGPILDYSGGVGSTCIGLAEMGIKCVYFGIGMAEYEFAMFRVRRKGLEKLVQFVKPYVDGAEGWHFDAVKSLKVGSSLKEKLGAVYALDVFEHIPNYEVTAAHLVSLLREGGKIFENSPFSQVAESEQDIHLKMKVPMSVALAGTQYVGAAEVRPRVKIWVKKGE